MILTKPRVTLLATVVAVCMVALATNVVRAADINYTIDSSQSYLTFVIPNFTLSGNPIVIGGQNPTNGAPSDFDGAGNPSIPWGPTTGNTAPISGTFMSDIGGPLTSVSAVAGGSIPDITFLNGQSGMAAGFTGLYRPNPAAWTPTSGPYVNNNPQFGSYGNTLGLAVGIAHAVAGETMATQIGYNIASSTLPVVAGSFATQFAGVQNAPLADNGLGPVGVGSGVFFASSDKAGGLYSVQGGGFIIPLFGPSPIPDIVLPMGFADQLSNGLTPGTIQFGGVEGGNGGLVGAGLGNLSTPASGAGSVGLAGNTLSVTVPLSIPFVLNVGGGVQVLGYLTGQVVGHATVPEPSTFALAGAGGLVALGAFLRQRRQRKSRSP